MVTLGPVQLRHGVPTEVNLAAPPFKTALALTPGDALSSAGAQTLLASHWKVSDKATSQLITEFIRRGRSGEPRALEFCPSCPSCPPRPLSFVLPWSRERWNSSPL